MVEKIGIIKNPLTIIAIFAGIAEVSGTIVLPFLSESKQGIFIYFLICFPILLVLLFFLTLNFNNRVLYAPSDYKDESNYIKINKYDLTLQKTIEVTVAKEDSKGQQLIDVNDKIEHLNSQIQKIENAVVKNVIQLNIQNEYIETIGYDLSVSNFENADKFVAHMRNFGIDFELYKPYGRKSQIFDNDTKHRAIWLGRKIRLQTAQFIIKESKQFYPHLKYIKLLDDPDDDKQLYIGGSTDSAINMFNRYPLKDSDFKELEKFTDIKSFHDFIDTFGA